MPSYFMNYISIKLMNHVCFYTLPMRNTAQFKGLLTEVR